MKEDVLIVNVKECKKCKNVYTRMHTAASLLGSVEKGGLA